VESKSVAVADIDVSRWQQLRDSSEPAQRERAAKLLAASLDPNRQKVVERFRPVLKMAGDVDRGKPLFVKHCSACHKLGDVGQIVGPDLVSRKDKSGESLLVAV